MASKIVGDLAHPQQAGSLKVHQFVLMKSRYPCKVVEMVKSKTGKHGSTKVHFTGLDIFTGNKHEDILPSSQVVLVPDVEKFDLPLISIDDEDFLSLLEQDGNTRNDLRLPETALGDSIKEKYDQGEVLLITLLSSMGTELIVDFKFSKD